MKKTLVAIATTALAAGAMAQVSVSGKLGFSYQKSAAVPGTSASHGMAMTDGDLNFAATEDLGGGMKAETKIAFAARGRDNSQAARDASITLKTSGAEYMFGSVEKCSRIDNVAGAPVSLASGHDSGTAAPLAHASFTLDDSCGNVDTVTVAVPLGPVTLGLSYNEAFGFVPPGTTAVTRRDATLNYTTVSLDGSLGALTLGLELRNARSTEGGLAQTYHDALTTTSVTAAYDFGGPVVGVGFKTANHFTPNQTTFSAAMPLGAAKVGLIYSARGKASNLNFGIQEEVNATAVGVDYSLSKQTTLNASYGTYSNSAVNGNEYRIRLMKAF